MAKWYGSLDNRLEEGNNYNTDKMIHEGDDITMYYWSDRTCYFVTKVINQKKIFVKKYEVVADREKEGGMGHENWKYFKSCKECNQYLREHGLEAVEDPIENREEEWVFRYGHWYEAIHYTLDGWKHCLEVAKKDAKEPDNEEKVKSLLDSTLD